MIASLGRMLALEISSGNGTWIGPIHIRPTFCKMKDIPIAVMRTASRGAFRRGLYATRSIPTFRRPQATIATKRATRTPRILKGTPELLVMGEKSSRPKIVPDRTVRPTKEPIMKLSPWAKLISSIIP
jgi:hypothetical protein